MEHSTLTTAAVAVKCVVKLKQEHKDFEEKGKRKKEMNFIVEIIFGLELILSGFVAGIVVMMLTDTKHNVFTIEWPEMAEFLKKPTIVIKHKRIKSRPLAPFEKILKIKKPEKYETKKPEGIHALIRTPVPYGEHGDEL